MTESQFTNSKFQSLIFPLSFPSLALISQTLLFPFLLRCPATAAATSQGNHRRHSSHGKSCGASWGLDRRRGGVSTPLTQLPAKLRLTTICTAIWQVAPRPENYSQSRAVALHNVESTITELSGIFTHLATMVAQQGELAIKIDDNMDESLSP
ncbi:hypothetical protein Tsubulata_051573 [Turnera subulata]|uniref:t-SNARE coiled-coil homology domain-containing protein n=1 Tax=Turnera subulata TaxID=218843 RepID=A0A9Q0FGN3_9ROSI|nr:hypothetical protein Tsubulata_051573 [Turnera subulata]